MKSKLYFPMFVDLSERQIVVVGGGVIATRRVNTLLRFTRNIKVVAPKATTELLEMGKAGKVRLYTRPVRHADFEGAYMVLAATNNRKLNDEIYRICKQEGIYVNVASDREKCDFYFPGIFIEEEVVVGITASGIDHKKARRVREEIQKALERIASEPEDEDED
ncbi:MAG: bifunctional precorrin-2 dehydrogenase/sirohydrochlorin ferrochelatase [Clostridiales bacterium]|nr:bifunctional precorrin-2 dehydrogenase/sirohydrochlorin ferrochelatase [Clostridiales bacterium]